MAQTASFEPLPKKKGCAFTTQLQNSALALRAPLNFKLFGGAGRGRGNVVRVAFSVLTPLGQPHSRCVCTCRLSLPHWRENLKNHPIRIKLKK